MYELIITEKPASAKKIADALADGKALKKAIDGVPYYELTRKGRDIVVCCAVGHLYGLEEKVKKGWTYPVFDIMWKPSAEISKASAHTKKYLNVIKKLCKDADEYTIATDYDVEGEVIGVNVVRLACKQKNAHRMKFSTLTSGDLVESYEHKLPKFDEGLALAGETRHFLDYYYGINLSRALTHSIKSAGQFKVLSSGRVQGPALKIIADREKEIRAFIATPFWQLELDGTARAAQLIALHEKDKFLDKKEAEAVHERTKGRDGKISKVGKNEFTQSPPHPFDLTTLQTEAFRALRIQPKETLEHAQQLYIGGFISYPRTSSQVLPKEIGYQKIIAALQRQEHYEPLCKELLKKPLNPNNGKKTDPAHPAIYPTGIAPDADGRAARVYDLIVKRFLATFAGPATRETVSIAIDVNNEKFLTSGTRTVVPGWHVYYAPYVPFKEVELPAVQEGDHVQVKEIRLLSKETQPPKRYTPASIIKELESRNLGTKATRAQIVDTLFQRGYVTGQPIEATELGLHTIDTLEKHSERIVDEALTRHFEEEMEEIQSKRKKSEDVLSEAKDVLTDILGNFKKKEKEIGKALLTANRESDFKAATIGACPACGGTLLIKRGKFGSFVACDKYPECTVTFKLPKTGKVVTSEKVCEQCKHPMIKIIKKRGAQEICLNPNCPSKKATEANQAELDKVTSGEVTKICPKCQGKLVVRRSVYGQFYGCGNFPKCRYIEKI